MKYLLLSLSCLFFSFSVWAQSFLPGTEDVPLMDNLKNVEETASFDNPEERMVLVTAETDESAETVLNFYQRTLSNLGWQQEKKGYFIRGQDSFFIEITPNGKKNQIQFRLSQSNI